MGLVEKACCTGSFSVCKHVRCRGGGGMTDFVQLFNYAPTVIVNDNCLWYLFAQTAKLQFSNTAIAKDVTTCKPLMTKQNYVNSGY